MVQLTTGPSEENGVDPGGSLPLSVELDIYKWLQDSEEVITNLMKKGTGLEEDVRSTQR